MYEDARTYKPLICNFCVLHIKLLLVVNKRTRD